MQTITGEKGKKFVSLKSSSPLYLVEVKKLPLTYSLVLTSQGTNNVGSNVHTYNTMYILAIAVTRHDPSHN